MVPVPETDAEAISCVQRSRKDPLSNVVKAKDPGMYHARILETNRPLALRSNQPD